MTHKKFEKFEFIGDLKAAIERSLNAKLLHEVADYYDHEKNEYCLPHLWLDLDDSIKDIIEEEITAACDSVAACEDNCAEMAMLLFCEGEYNDRPSDFDLYKEVPLILKSRLQARLDFSYKAVTERWLKHAGSPKPNTDWKGRDHFLATVEKSVFKAFDEWASLHGCSKIQRRCHEDRFSAEGFNAYTKAVTACIYAVTSDTDSCYAVVKDVVGGLEFSDCYAENEDYEPISIFGVAQNVLRGIINPDSTTHLRKFAAAWVEQLQKSILKSTD